MYYAINTGVRNINLCISTKDLPPQTPTIDAMYTLKLT